MLAAAGVIRAKSSRGQFGFEERGSAEMRGFGGGEIPWQVIVQSVTTIHPDGVGS